MPADAPGYRFNNVQVATRLANGNTLVNNWFNQWNGRSGPIEPAGAGHRSDPDKKIVWRCARGCAPDLGPSTTIQLLDRKVRRWPAGR